MSTEIARPHDSVQVSAPLENLALDRLTAGVCHVGHALVIQVKVIPIQQMAYASGQRVGNLSLNNTKIGELVHGLRRR